VIAALITKLKVVIKMSASLVDFRISCITLLLASCVTCTTDSAILTCLHVTVMCGALTFQLRSRTVVWNHNVMIME